MHTEKLKIDGTHTDGPIDTQVKNVQNPDHLRTEHKELLKTPQTASTHTLVTTHSDITSSQSSIPSMHKEQSVPQKLDQMTQEGLPDVNSREDITTVKYPQPQDSIVPQHENTEPVAEVKALQKPAQSAACLKAETPAGLYNCIFIVINLQMYLYSFIRY